MPLAILKGQEQLVGCGRRVICRRCGFGFSHLRGRRSIADAGGRSNGKYRVAHSNIWPAHLSAESDETSRGANRYKDSGGKADGSLGRNVLMIRRLVTGCLVSFLALGLLAPMAAAKKKPHPATSHPKPSKHAKAAGKVKVKPHKAG